MAFLRPMTLRPSISDPRKRMRVSVERQQAVRAGASSPGRTMPGEPTQWVRRRAHGRLPRAERHAGWARRLRHVSTIEAPRCRRVDRMQHVADREGRPDLLVRDPSSVKGPRCTVHLDVPRRAGEFVAGGDPIAGQHHGVAFDDRSRTGVDCSNLDGRQRGVAMMRTTRLRCDFEAIRVTFRRC